MASRRGRNRFNVGGKIFETNAATRCSASSLMTPGTSARLAGTTTRAASATSSTVTLSASSCSSTSSACTCELHVPEKLLYREARWGPFDGNRLQMASSISGRAPGDGTGIRAGPDGGCCVAHGGMVHVYNWMLEEHRPRQPRLRTGRDNDVGYIDADSIVVTACQVSIDGGMGVFSASTGELRQRLRVSHDNQIKSFSARRAR